MVFKIGDRVKVNNTGLSSPDSKKYKDQYLYIKKIFYDYIVCSLTKNGVNIGSGGIWNYEVQLVNNLQFKTYI